MNTEALDTLTRYEYKQLCDLVMDYCKRELGMDSMAVLPFVTNIVNTLQPEILRQRKAYVDSECKKARIDELEKTLISGCWGKPMQQRENHIRKRIRSLNTGGNKSE